MNDTSGPTSGTQFATYDLGSQSWKMWPDTGLWGLIEYSATFPKTGYMQDGRAYEHPTSAHPTTAKDSSSWLPTPRAAEAKQAMGSPGAARHVAAGMGGLTEVIGVRMLPTPVQSDHKRGEESPADAARNSPGLTVVSKHFPTPRTTDANGPVRHGQGGAGPSDGHSRTDWGTYAPAVRRWEAVTRPAPAPTELNSNGKPRLAAEFAEYMMGLPAGHVTQVPGISRADQLKAIGNGVCPQQATAAIRQLLAMQEAA